MPAPAPSPTHVDQGERPPAATGPSAVARGCGACPHPADDHDAIALRFCRATLDSALDRGCVCRTAGPAQSR